jgi:hypothetical protein
MHNILKTSGNGFWGYQPRVILSMIRPETNVHLARIQVLQFFTFLLTLEDSLREHVKYQLGKLS